MRLRDRAAIINGGDEGIGRATVVLSCKEERKVGIMGWTTLKLDRVAKEAES